MFKLKTMLENLGYSPKQVREILLALYYIKSQER